MVEIIVCWQVLKVFSPNICQHIRFPTINVSYVDIGVCTYVYIHVRTVSNVFTATLHNLPSPTWTSPCVHYNIGKTAHLKLDLPPSGRSSLSLTCLRMIQV